MLYICSISKGKYGIKDTEDGVIEYVNSTGITKLASLVKSGVIKIKGIDLDGNVSVYTPQTVTTKEVIDHFLHIMQRTSGGQTMKDYKDGIAGVRYWGDWISTDEEDCDFEKLDPMWYGKLSEIRKELKAKYPMMNISIQTCEKNWIELIVSKKK